MKRRTGALLLSLLASAGAVMAMDSGERLQFANGLYRRDLFELALPEFNALLTDPAATNLHDTAAFRIAECHRQLGQTNEAAAAYDRVLQQFPQSSFSPRAAFRRAELDWQAGRLRDAARKFQQLADRKPGEELEAAALYHLGQCQSGLDRFDDAKRTLRRLVTDFPASPYTDYGRILLADLLAREDPVPAEAVTLLDAVVNEPETPALGAEALAKSGLLAYLGGNHAQAADRLAALATNHPDSPWVDRTRLESGWAHQRAGRTDAARIIARRGLETADDTDRAAWLYLLANVERQAGQTEEARATYRQLMEIAPDHELVASAAFEALNLAWQAGDYPEVLVLAPRARGPADRELALRWMEAESYRATGDKEKAVAAYEQIIRAFPESEQAAGAGYQLALFAMEKGDFAASASGFAKVASSHPGSAMAPDAWLAAAVAWQKAGRQAEAADAYATLIDKHPTYPALDEAHLGRARALTKLGREAEAEGSLTAVIALSTNRNYLSEAEYLLGTRREREERFAEADQHYLRALAQSPEPAFARQIQLRRVAVLQRQERNAEAATLMNTLVREGAGGELPPALLEWLARWNIGQSAYAEAETAARLLAAQGGTDGWRLLGYYLTGIACQRQGRNEDAAPAFEQAAAIPLNARERADAMFQLGAIALAAGRAPEAITQFTRAAEAANADALMDLRARAYLQLGAAHESLGQLAEAGRFYLSVGVLFDDPSVTPESLFRAAAVFEAQQQAGRRDQLLAELKQRYPDSEWTRQAAGRWP